MWPKRQLANLAFNIWATGLRWAAIVWRRMLRNTTFIAITGSMGKTTTKELLVAMLGSHYPVRATPGNSNLLMSLYWIILTTRPRHRFVILEVAVSRPGFMKRQASVVKPDMAVMLGAKRAHMAKFQTLDAIVEDKKQLLLAVKPGGTVFLNRDDQRLLPVADELRSRIVWFGESAEADVRIVNSESR